MEAKKEYYRVTAESIIKNFKKRNIEGYYCSTSKEATKKAMELIEEGSTVSWGGSMTLGQIGLFEKLKEANLELLDRSTAETPEETVEIYFKALLRRFFLVL